MKAVWEVYINPTPLPYTMKAHTLLCETASTWSCSAAPHSPPISLAAAPCLFSIFQQAINSQLSQLSTKPRINLNFSTSSKTRINPPPPSHPFYQSPYTLPPQTNLNGPALVPQCGSASSSNRRLPASQAACPIRRCGRYGLETVRPYALSSLIPFDR